MTVLSTYTALQELHGRIIGVKKAPLKLPTKIDTSDLPLVLTYPGGASWNEHATGLRRQQRTYLVRVYVKPIAQGNSPDEGFQALLPLLQAFGDAYLADQLLGGAVDQIVTSDEQLRDSGAKVLQFSSIDYHGFEFSVSTIEKYEPGA